MDSWATDGFYSHFPSYSQQPNRREALAKARQQDYRTFLSRLSPQKGEKSHKRFTVHDEHAMTKTKTTTMNHIPNDELPKLDLYTNDDDSSSGSGTSSLTTSRDRFVNELERMNLPDIFNEETVLERNQKLIEEKRLRNIEYQRELMAQIEQKRHEREIQKAKDLEEEERMTRRMEEQLKTVRLQDEIDNRKIRNREHRLISLELSKPPISGLKHVKLPTTVRSDPVEQVDAFTYRSYDERKAQSDHGKENWLAPKRNDKDLYNFFRNSALSNQTNQLKNIRFSHYFDLDEFSESEALSNSLASSTYNTYPLKSLRHQHDSRRPLCSFCKQNRSLALKQNENVNSNYICNTCENEPICLNCRREICVRCKRSTKGNANAVKASPFRKKNFDSNRQIVVIKKHIERPTKPVRVQTESFQPILTEDDDYASTSDHSTTDHHKPYSFNIDESSLFHPSRSRLNRKLSVNVKNGEVSVKPNSFDELKRITEEKLSKLSKNYGDIKPKKPGETNEHESNRPEQQTEIVSYHKLTSDSIPILHENTKKLLAFAKELDRGDKNMFRSTQPKCKLASIQEKKIVESQHANTSTLTQVGAIKKEMKLDKLKF